MSWHKPSSLGGAICAAAFAVSCASSGTGATQAPEDRLVPPRMVSRAPLPQLRVSTIPASGRSPIRVRFEVLIDAGGQPDMRTFRATGMGAAENEEPLRRWVESSTWAPATLDGRPVAHVYKGSFEVRVVTRVR